MSTFLRKTEKTAINVIRLTIAGYQLLISPILPRSCRFYPTCSTYAAEALEVHGFFKGLALAAWRLAKCHPFHPGGFDPVPPVRDKKALKDRDG